MNNPQAFPQYIISNNGTYVDGGMTLRDYMAAKALQAFITAWIAKSIYFDTDLEVAEYAYKMADAMLVAREKS